MKRYIAILVAAALLAAVAPLEAVAPFEAVAPLAFAEDAGFSLRKDITWGMTRQAVLDAEKGANPKADAEAGFDIVEIDGAKIYGFPCDLEYFFKGDALMACVCDYDQEDSKVTFQALEAALTADYGDPADPDTERWMLMADILDGEMEERRTDSYACWVLADGTLIALAEDAAEGDIELGFYDEMKLVEGML